MNEAERNEAWPALPFADWKETCATLHMWMQIVGKVRLSKTPWLNHSWHVTLYITARGLTTSPIWEGNRTFQIDFDFIDHEVVLLTSEGRERHIPLRPSTVATFYRELLEALHTLEIEAHFLAAPNEVEPSIPFAQDEKHRSYDPAYATRFWCALLQADRLFKFFRTRFLGKCSPVHFFWGSCDLAVTRFSGRPAPQHPGGVPHLPDRVTREAYSHEVSSCGFWPGNEAMPEPVFYSYAYPEPPGFAQYKIGPSGASYNPAIHEFILPYEKVRSAANPDDLVLEFLQSSYEAAAILGKWDRTALEQTKPFAK